MYKELRDSEGRFEGRGTVWHIMLYARHGMRVIVHAPYLYTMHSS